MAPQLVPRGSAESLVAPATAIAIVTLATAARLYSILRPIVAPAATSVIPATARQTALLGLAASLAMGMATAKAMQPTDVKYRSTRQQTAAFAAISAIPAMEARVVLLGLAESPVGSSFST